MTNTIRTIDHEEINEWFCSMSTLKAYQKCKENNLRPGDLPTYRVMGYKYWLGEKS